MSDDEFLDWFERYRWTRQTAPRARVLAWNAYVRKIALEQGRTWLRAVDVPRDKRDEFMGVHHLLFN